MDGRICPICDKEVTLEDKRYWFGNDRPYLNVLVHRPCYDQNRSNLMDLLPKMLESYRKWRKKR